MPGGINLATKYSSHVDERFSRESQAMLALNNEYKFQGDKVVKVYSIPIVALNDYTRSGTSRYGTPDDLSRNVQTMTVSKDRAFTFIIDKGDKVQSEMVSDAGKALARQLREVVVPEFDTYVFKTLANAAIARGNYETSTLTAQNAYEYFLKAMEKLGDNYVPDKGRVAFCSYKFANLLKQDASFMKYGDKSQEMLEKGVIGEVDGCKIVKVPNAHLPAGAAFIITHPIAATAPKQLEEYKIHDDPPGISGYLVEGRFIYDCFVLNEKADAVYYHGGQSIMKHLNASTSPIGSGKTRLVVNGALEGSKRYYMSATSAAGLTALTFGSAITVANWTELTAASTDITPTATHTVMRVCEVDAASKPIAYTDVVINV